MEADEIIEVCDEIVDVMYKRNMNPVEMCRAVTHVQTSLIRMVDDCFSTELTDAIIDASIDSIKSIRRE